MTGIYGDSEDEVDGSKNEEDIDNDPEVVVDSSDESDANHNTKVWVYNKAYINQNKVLVIICKGYIETVSNKINDFY